MLSIVLSNLTPNTNNDNDNDNSTYASIITWKVTLTNSVYLIATMVLC